MKLIIISAKRDYVSSILMLIVILGVLLMPLQSANSQNSEKGKIRNNQDIESELTDIKKRLDDLENSSDKADDKYKLKVSGFFDVNMSNYNADT